MCEIVMIEIYSRCVEVYGGSMEVIKNKYNIKTEKVLAYKSDGQINLCESS